MEIADLPRPSRRLTRLLAFVLSLAALSCATVGLAAGIGSASVLSTVAGILPNCGVTNATTPFARWGDTNAYFLMPNGGFESGTTGWAPGSAKVVAGNESFFASSTTDSHSLAIPGGATVTSPTACVAMGENTVRLFVKNPGVTGSTLHIQAYVQNPLTGLVLSTGFNLNSTAGATTWAPTARLSIPNLLGGVLGTQNVTLVFTTKGSGTWGIDDVFIDPFRTR